MMCHEGHHSVYALGIKGSLTAGLLLPQAIIRDRDTFFKGLPQAGRSMDLADSGKSSAAAAQKGPIAIIVTFIMMVFFFLSFVLPIFRHH
jgi:hypothetical protein